MSRTSDAQMRLHLEELAKLLAEGYNSDKQLMQELNLKRRTFYYHKAKIVKLWGDIAARRSEQSLEFQAQVLADRFLRLYRQLEQNITNGNDRLRDKADAAHAAAELAIKIFQLEVEGVRARRLKQVEAKAQTYLR